MRWKPFLPDILLHDLSTFEATNPPTKIGFVELHYYNIELALNNGYDIFEAFSRSINTTELGEILIDLETGTVKDEIRDAYETNHLNILVIEDFGIYPEFRSKGFGKKVLQGLIDQWTGKCGYIVLKSFPKQHEDERALGASEQIRAKMSLGLLEKNFTRAQKKLNTFYLSCGFNPLLREKNYFIYNYL